MNEFIDIIKITGPVGAIAIIFLYFMDKKDERTNKLIEEHMDRTTKTLSRHSEALSKLIGLINVLGKTLKGKVIK